MSQVQRFLQLLNGYRDALFFEVVYVGGHHGDVHVVSLRIKLQKQRWRLANVRNS